MPWTVDEVDKHNKGLSDKQKKQWVAVANSALAKCEKDGGKDCEASAIRQANAAVAKESAKLQVAAWMSEQTQEAFDRILQAVEAEDVSEAVTKSEDGKNFPASDFAYVPDPEKSSTWKLRLTATPGGEPDAGIVGAACAALGKGFRGQKVDIPSGDLAKVKAKVRSAWKKANPDKDPDEMPDAIKESIEELLLQDEFVPLREKALEAKSGMAKLKIIQPGWGSSGYYSKEILQRDGPVVFKKGTQMFLDHPTEAEERDRPEGTVKNLAAELQEDAKFDEKGPDGAGLYATAKVFSHVKDFLRELAPHIGVSIRAMGRAKKGEAEGRKGPIIEEIAAAKSVDFVTAAGAGGKVLAMVESLRQGQQINKEDKDMAEIKELQERITALETENKALLDKCLGMEARALADAAIAKAEVPEPAKTRVLEAVVHAALPVKEGKLDVEAFNASLKEVVDKEKAYIASLAGESGKIRGMGPSSEDAPKGALKADLKARYLKEGRSEAEAERMAEIAATGR